MRWNQFANDPARARTLGDILLGAATASGPLDDIKIAVVRGQVAKALGVCTLPPELVDHTERFDGARFDAAAACRALGLSDLRDRVALMKTVAMVLRAEGIMTRPARSYALRLAAILEIPVPDVVSVVGLPSRPVTAPRPRPTLQLAAVGPGCAADRTASRVRAAS